VRVKAAKEEEGGKRKKKRSYGRAKFAQVNERRVLDDETERKRWMRKAAERWIGREEEDV
jgi:hypothetical protein